MREIDAYAHLNRWRDRTIETTLLCAGLLLCAMVHPTPLSASLAGLVVAACLAAAGIPFAAFLRAARLPLGFLVLGTLPLCASVAFEGGHPVVSIAPGGAEVALRTGLRSASALSATLLLALTTPFPRLARLLRALRVPASLVDLLGLVYRSIFALDESLRVASIALASRQGFRDRAATARTLPLLASGAFVRSFTRASRLETALSSRLGGDGLDVLIPPSRPRPSGIFAGLAVPAAVLVATLLLESVHVR